MGFLLIALMAAAAGAEPADQLPPPKTVSPLTVTAQPKSEPHADVTVNLETDDESIDPQRVSVWSQKAWESGKSGKVVLSCFVDVHGIAERCHVLWEEPQGLGLGSAALELQPTLKLTPIKGADGQPVAGTENIALAFKKPNFDNNLQNFETTIGVGGGHGCSSCADLQMNHNPMSMRHIVMLNHPVWSAAPSFDDLARTYPMGGRDVEGFAVAHCEVTRSGTLTACVPVKESPGGHGFADATVRLAAKFKVSPEVMKYAPHGDPIEVDVPIRFPAKAELAQRTVTAPAWLAGVDPEAVPKVFPPEAAAKGLTIGHGVARCTVAADGALTACQPETSEPDGLGFGEAAAKLAASMRMNLWSSDAQPVEGGTVRVAIQLNLAGGN